MAPRKAALTTSASFGRGKMKSTRFRKPQNKLNLKKKGKKKRETLASLASLLSLAS